MADQLRPSRHEELLDAAIRAFARGGYAGTSVAEVATEAGVTQPYISQVFGNKERLFIEAHQRAGDQVLATFADAAARAGGFDSKALGLAYADLVIHRLDLLMMFSHGFTASRHEAIAAEARRLFAEVYRLLAGLGASELEIREFLGRGMLVNNLVSMRVFDHADELGLTGFLATVLAT